MLQGQIHSVHLIFSRSFSSVGTHRAILSETSNDHALCCMLNPGNTLMQLLHCLSLSSCQLESTLPPGEQSLLSQQGNLVGHHLWLSNVLDRISWLSCEPLYVTNTFHCKQKTLLYEYPLHWVLLPTEKRIIQVEHHIVASSWTSFSTKWFHSLTCSTSF
jgi:hypothetical protein